ncbi:uncharacterized protein LOC114363585 [Ostrinia furnacalis]|uniref:uncharacterized protein LOC114363585 n=1 Tax=Ostrinia furnacalis TaxID=93504 RepID=UPI00103DD5F2|nr:uncharacterized protein LOC114363585 [Ostrinia furnacalis]
MSKFFILFVVAAVAVSCIKADEEPNNPPNFPNNGLLNPFNFGNGFGQPFAPLAMLNPDYIKNMKPGPGQVVSGASVSSSSSSETVNGVTKRKSFGRVVTNDDGKVTDVSF